MLVIGRCGKWSPAPTVHSLLLVAINDVISSSTKRDSGTVETAVLVGRRVEFAATAPTGGASGGGRSVSVRSAVQRSITALARPDVVDDRLAAARARAEETTSDGAGAAQVRRRAVRRSVAARLLTRVDDGAGAAARRVVAESLREDRLVAAQVRPVVVDDAAAARRAPAVRAIQHGAVAAADGRRVVEHGAAAAQRVPAVQLVVERAAAADPHPVVVGGVTAAAGVRAELPASQLAATTDLAVAVVDRPAAAAVRGEG